MFNYTTTKMYITLIYTIPTAQCTNLHAKVFQAFNLCKLKWEETEQSTGNSFLFERFKIFAFSCVANKKQGKRTTQKKQYARKYVAIYSFSTAKCFTTVEKHIKCGVWAYCSLSCSKRLIQLFVKYFKRFRLLMWTTKQRIQFTIWKTN